MRLLLSVLASLATGFVIAYLALGRPVTLRPAATETERTRAAGTTPGDAALSVGSAAMTTDAKAQRLLAAALRGGNSLEDEDELYQAIQALEAEDFRSFLSDIGAIKEVFAQLDRKGVNNPAALALLLRRWMQVDGTAVMAWLPRISQFVKDRNARSRILETLARERPEELLAAAAKSGASERGEIIDFALAALAAKSPAKAQAWLASCTDANDRQRAGKAIRRGLVQGDPLRAIELATSLTNRAEALELVQQGMARARESGLALVRRLASQPMPDWLIPAVLPELCMESPIEALDLAVKFTNMELDGNVARSVSRAFGALASTDREMATHKLDEFTGAWRAAAVSGFAEGWAAQDPAAALEWLSTLPASDRISPNRGYGGSSDTLDLAFQDWAGRDLEKARAWTESLPAGDLRKRMLGRLAQSFSRSGDPAQGMQLLAGTEEAPDPEAAKNLARSWAAKDGPAAADWAVTQASPALQEQTLPMIVKTWSDEDEHAVASWIAQFPEGQLRDRCVLAYLQRSTKFSAAASEQIAEFDAWFATINDPRLRTEAALGTLPARRLQGLASAEAWLASLTNVDQQKIQKALKPR